MEVKIFKYKNGSDTFCSVDFPNFWIPTIDWVDDFIDKHRGLKKELLQDYLNLFIFIDNEKKTDGDLYKVTIKLLKLMCEQAKSGLDIN